AYEERARRHRRRYFIGHPYPCRLRPTERGKQLDERAEESTGGDDFAHETFCRGGRLECVPRLATIANVKDRIPIIVDCDTGIDDSLALLYACASPEAELIAATCVAGNVDARQVAENTRAVLELAGRPDVEVALG